MISIDKSVDINEFDSNKPVGGSIQNEYPVAVMDIGDSFLIPKGKWSENTRGRVHNYGYYNCKKYATRKSPCGGLRVWRTE